MSPKIKKEVLEFSHGLYYLNEITSIGRLSRLALEPGNWKFQAIHIKGDTYKMTDAAGLSFVADLKAGKGKDKGTYSIKGCVSYDDDTVSFFDNVNINGVGESGWRMRRAQLGSIHALLAHWSLNSDVATVVLPTGTGKTETMLATKLVDRANRTLVVVPTIDLKHQIAEKFACWGMLRKLGVIPINAPNPTVLVLSKTLKEIDSVDILKRADVVVTTPAFIARAPQEVQMTLASIFSHIYFDEAHHVVAKEWNALKALFINTKIVQFTATPYRNDRRPIEGSIVYNYPVSLAVEDKCFAKISLIAVDERHPKKKDKAIADAAMIRLKADREAGFVRHTMMVRAADKRHASVLFGEYMKWFPNERIALIHSQIKGRRSIVQNIKNDNYDIVVCVDMLREGFDYPNFKIAAVHGVHKSLAVLLQFIGRFTRTQEGLGDASFVVNYADEKMSTELEGLFQEGSGWENIVKEVADAKKIEAESLLAFLQQCKPYVDFDKPDIELNPKLVYPALSCVCYACPRVNWKAFSESFNLKLYALSKPYINTEQSVFYFTTQKREKVKWARTEKMRHQTWDLVVMHHDKSKELLYIGYSEKRLDVQTLVDSITNSKNTALSGDCVFRSFDAIKRLSIVHAGIFKPANHLHRYSRLSGADVTTELTRWKAGNRCQKSDFVGFGYRDGFPVSIGASVKGKIWSPARVGDLREWKAWCVNIGRLITDENIDSNQLLEESAKKVELEQYPQDIVVLATDWAESLYDRMHKLTLERGSKYSMMLSEVTLRFVSHKSKRAKFTLSALEDTVDFIIDIGGEQGHSVKGLDESEITIEGLKNTSIPIKQFFQENPPTLFLMDGCTISGCIHTDFGQADSQEIPDERISILEWDGVDFKVESVYKHGKKRRRSIQEYMMKRLVSQGYKVVFNDDNSGESADIVAIMVKDGLVRFELIHCKYSKEKSGSRLSDLYEVCGQAIVSLRYKWKPEELLKHLERRNGAGVLKGMRFFHGDLSDLHEVKEALKYSDVQFEFAIAQPGVEASKMTADMNRFLGSIYSTVVEMTETKLRCYFNE